MAENKIIGYKNIFGFVLPDWVDEGMIKTLVAILLSMIVMLFVLILVIWPKFSEISRMKSSLITSETSLNSLRASKTDFDQLNDQISESTQNLILSAIPSTYSPENAVFLLRKLASEIPDMAIVSYNLPSGVLFESTPALGTLKTNNDDLVRFINYPIRLSVTAPIKSLLNFINKIETSLPLGVVSDLGMQEMTKLVSKTTTNAVQIELEISYYQVLLQKVDISRVSSITPEDLVLVNNLRGFRQVSAFGMTDTVSPVTTNGTAQSVFGF